MSGPLSYEAGDIDWDSRYDAIWEAVTKREEWECPVGIWLVCGSGTSTKRSFIALPRNEGNDEGRLVGTLSGTQLDALGRSASRRSDIVFAANRLFREWGFHPSPIVWQG